MFRLKIRFVKNQLFLLAGMAGLFLSANGKAQEGPLPTGTVYFIGIGIENCGAAGIQNKPLAKNDVLLVKGRAEDDLNKIRLSYYSKELQAQIKYDNFVGKCLFDAEVSQASVDHLFNEIAAVAKPYDIFYFYINARSDARTGSFYLQQPPLKKGEKPGAQPMLELTKLNEFFAKISCLNQVILIDDPSLKNSRENFQSHFFNAADKKKKQVLLVPDFTVADTILLAGNKKGGLTAAVIASMNISMLNIFDASGITDIKMEMLLTAFEFTKKHQDFVTVFEPTFSAGQPSIAEVTPAVDAGEIASAKVPPAAKTEPASRGPVEINKAAIADSIIGAITNYALIVGVSDYKDSAWPDLVNPVSDAMALNTELINHYGFQTNLLKNPTKAELFSALKALVDKKFDQNSQVLVFFAGHGAKNNFEGFFVPADGKNPDADPEMNSFITYGTLLKMIKSIPAKHVLLMIDACYSGTIDEDAMAFRSQADKKKDMDKLRMVSEKMNYSFRGYIASGITPVSDGRAGEHSPFMNEVLECLRNGYSENNVVTFYTLSGAVDKITTPAPRHSPISKDPGGDFLFIPQQKR